MITYSQCSGFDLTVIYEEIKLMEQSIASLTWWTWVWVNSRSWWWTGRPGVLRFMGLQTVGHDWATELNWTEDLPRLVRNSQINSVPSYGNQCGERTRVFLSIPDKLWCFLFWDLLWNRRTLYLDIETSFPHAVGVAQVSTKVYPITWDPFLSASVYLCCRISKMPI